MKQLFAFFLVALSAQPLLAQSAAEKAEKRLAELLSPGAGTTASGFTGKPMAWQAARIVSEIGLSIQPYAGTPVRLPMPPHKEVKPGALREEKPLLAYKDRTPVPVPVELPTTALIRLPSVDLHAPLPIPILAQPAKDRAALGEPGFEASLDATLKRWAPKRDLPVPFAPLNLPDPFENLRYGQLRHIPEENATPPVIPLQKPTK